MFVIDKIISVSACVVLLSACSSLSREPAPVVTVIDRSDDGKVAMITRQDPHQISAIDKLMKDAQVWLDKGQYVKAVATLERALRIKPRNPGIWAQLAQVRYSQQQYSQAESLALRSNQYAGSDDNLKRHNWELIANARDKQGNKTGAIAARKKAAE